MEALHSTPFAISRRFDSLSSHVTNSMDRAARTSKRARPTYEAALQCGKRYRRLLSDR